MQQADHIATMGQGRKAAKTGTRFLELKSTVLDRLRSIYKLVDQVKELERAGYGGYNAKEIIRLQSEVRSHLQQASEELFEMEEIYKKEIRKKRSKFTPEELAAQSELVKQVGLEIEKVKKDQLRGNARARVPDAAVLLNTQTLAQVGAGGGVALSDHQRQRVFQIEERDADYDRQLVDIEIGVETAKRVAELQGEEVRNHNKMLDNANNKVDEANGRMFNVNSRLSKDLIQVLTGDRFCLKLFCIVFAICLGAAIYYFAVTKKQQK